MKPWQTPLNKTPSKRGKERTKKEDPRSSQESWTRSGLIRVKGKNHVSKSPPIIRNITEREKD
jgi:hypothetical protein